jgi:hypothetical protein
LANKRISYSEGSIEISIRDRKLSIRLIGLIFAFGGLLMLVIIAILDQKITPSFYNLLESLAVAGLIFGLLDIFMETIFVSEYFERRILRVLENQGLTKSLLDLRVSRMSELLAIEVCKKIMFREETLKELLGESDKLDEVGTNILQVKLRNLALGHAVWESLVEWFAILPTSIKNHVAKATLSNFNDKKIPNVIRKEYFLATIDITFVTKIYKSIFKFCCGEDEDNWRKQSKSPGEFEFSWLIPSGMQDFKGYEDLAFNIKSITIDGAKLNRVKDNNVLGVRTIEYSSPEIDELMANQREVRVHYVIDVAVTKRGHLLRLFVVFPADSATFELDFSQVDEIQWVLPIDSFVSRKLPDNQSKHPRKAIITLDDWIFPQTGVCFVWRLKNEEFHTDLQIPKSYVREEK